MTSSFEKVHYQYTDAGNKFVTSPRQQFTTSVNCPNETLIVSFELVFFLQESEVQKQGKSIIFRLLAFSQSCCH